MSMFSRREFLKDSALLAAAAATVGGASAADVKPAKKVGANDRIRVAVIGYKGRDAKKPISGRGGSHIDGFCTLPDSVVTCLCDVDANLSDKAIQHAEEKQKGAARPKFVQDMRRIFDDKEIDAVAIATPNHWHALAAIWAMQAGKDVYVEKPVSHNVWEGRRMVDAARHYNKICQTGTQSRSANGTREFMDYLHEGKIGRIEVARALCYKGRGSIGAKAETQPPDGLDYDLWCGPAPKDPVMRKSLHYDWHWIWNYGNGDLGNQGIHEMDRARWGLNKNTLCNAVYSYGGRFGYEDAGETANTQVCLFDYGDCKLFFEVRGLGTKDFENQKLGSVKGAKVSVIFEGTDGYAVSYNYSGGTVFSKDGQKVKEFKGGENHFANFLKAVRSRKHTDLTADIEEGHLSSALCHLGNISYRMGEVEKLNPNKKFDLELQQETFDRFVSHLKDNKVEVDGLPVRFGKWLGFNPKTEKFLENSQANAMLTREYRAPFVVPEKF